MTGGAETLRQLLRGPSPLLVVLAGPNGAGKSTFYAHYLASEGLPFVNADLIARALAPGDPGSVASAAVQIATRHRLALLDRGASFVLETVFSDPVGDKLDFLRRAQAQGFAVFLVFIGLDSPMLSQARVAGRVERGGHDVPEQKLTERFPRTLANLRQAIGFVDLALLFDNSVVKEPFRFVAAYEHGKVVESTALRPRWVVGLPGLAE